MNEKLLTSFTSIRTAEGERIGYTFSEIDGDGIIVTDNNKRSIVVSAKNTEVLAHIEAIREFLIGKMEG